MEENTTPEGVEETPVTEAPAEEAPATTDEAEAQSATNPTALRWGLFFAIIHKLRVQFSGRMTAFVLFKYAGLVKWYNISFPN